VLNYILDSFRLNQLLEHAESALARTQLDLSIHLGFKG